MTCYYQSDFTLIYHGDCRDILSSLPKADVCITDPPYGLSFMGKGWDHGVPGVQFWELILAALLPGAMCLAFGGTRTHHRLMVAIEDAGFEIRDVLMWLYGTGFPKSHNISKALDKEVGARRVVTGVRKKTHGHGGSHTYGGDVDRHGIIETTEPATAEARKWDGWGTALKPAWEPIVLAMKPRDGTFAANALTHGVAGLNIDGARIPGAAGDGHWTHRREIGDGNIYGGGGRTDEDFGNENPSPYGRWPANVMLDEESARLLDEFGGTGDRYGDSGGASRFFYTAKASRRERGEGNDHPTVKPTALMEWLVLLTRNPTGGIVLDPFMGSGSTLVAATKANVPSIGIEIDEHYCEIAAMRLRELDRR